MKVAQSTINIRMDKPLKEEAESLLHELGLNMTTAINMFVRQLVSFGGIPFEVKRDRNKPLRGEAYLRELRESARQFERGEVVVKTLEELKAYEK